MAKKKRSRKIPKVDKLVSGIASFLDKGHEEGTHFNMAQLKDEVGIHSTTTRKKITEGFIWKKVLQGWEETKRSSDNMVDSIKRVNKEISMATILDVLSSLDKEVKSLRAEIKALKK